MTPKMEDTHECHISNIFFPKPLIIFIVRSHTRGLLVIVFAIGPKVRVFKPGLGRWIFKGDESS
jgi:hypothetical protein